MRDRKEYLRNYQRLWMRQRRAAFFSDKSCVDCGSIEQLELDHIDPSTKVSHRIWSWCLERRDQEIAKCVVRCKACHRVRTNEQNTRPIVHGTTAGYDHKSCRCCLCKAAKAQRNSLRDRRQKPEFEFKIAA